MITAKITETRVTFDHPNRPCVMRARKNAWKPYQPMPIRISRKETNPLP